MANEATITSLLRIKAGNLDEMQRSQFTATVTGRKGPSPGAVLVGTTPTPITFSELTTPGLCFIRNIDATNFVEIGTYDGVTFLPLFKYLPGEGFPCRLSSDFDAGTGTSFHQFAARANTAACVIQVNAYEV